MFPDSNRETMVWYNITITDPPRSRVQVAAIQCRGDAGSVVGVPLVGPDDSAGRAARSPLERAPSDTVRRACLEIFATPAWRNCSRTRVRQHEPPLSDTGGKREGLCGFLSGDVVWIARSVGVGLSVYSVS